MDTVEVLSPFDGRVLANVPSQTRSHVHDSIGIAHEAFTNKPAPEPYERAEVLEQACVLLTQRSETFAKTISDEAGKPIAIARAEVERALDTLRFSAIEARLLTGDVIPMGGTSSGSAALGFTMRNPVGVVAAITPFNFPLNLVCHKLAPAIAAGCPIVHKPASSTPLTSILFHELLIEAGVKSERLHLVTGSGQEVGDALVVDPRIRHLSFTGSSEVGWQIPKRVHRARVSLELGNSTPLVVFDDADIDAVARAVSSHGFSFAGQSCISVQRLLIESSIYEHVVEQVATQVGRLSYGDPSDDSVICGPVIDEKSRERILQSVRDATNAGAKLVVGGGCDGNVIEPTLLTDVDPGLDVSRSEIFGPVVVATPFQTESEAIALANGTPYGLQAGVYTTNIDRSLRMARSLEFGGITINMSPTYRADQMPYGGVKESGNTKEGPRWVVRELTDERLLLFG